MSVASHLRIELAEYDQKIRTFVPHYETMLNRIAGALTLVEATAPTIVDLGIGTGALSEACLAVRPEAHMIGIDADPGMLESARARLEGRGSIEFRTTSFLDDPLPGAHAMVACIALHHIRDAQTKRAFYATVYGSLLPGGMLISGDCFPGSAALLAVRHRAHWLAHLGRHYTAEESRAYLDAWADEDTYYPLLDELSWLREAGFSPEVLWRSDGFAVLAGLKRTSG